jgi:hypothetical protein
VGALVGTAVGAGVCVAVAAGVVVGAGTAAARFGRVWLRTLFGVAAADASAAGIGVAEGV